METTNNTDSITIEEEYRDFKIHIWLTPEEEKGSKGYYYYEIFPLKTDQGLINTPQHLISKNEFLHCDKMEALISARYTVDRFHNKGSFY